MSAPAIFVSHSHQDDTYCHTFVTALRGAGLDVWYDEHNATAGHLVDVISHEIRQRPVFIVILTPAALTSDWVKDECTWAYNRWQKDKANRVMLPVLAATVVEDDIWDFLQVFRRVEQPGLRPWPVAEAARRAALAIDPNAPLMPAQSHAAPPPMPTSDHSAELDTLLARANALVSQGKRRDAIEVLRRATALAPRSVAAWNALGFNLDYLNQTAESLEVFERVLLIDPSNVFAWAGKANSLSLDYPQQALLCAEKAIALDPKSAFAFSGKGVALDGLGRHKESLDACERAITLDTNFAPAWSNKGNALYSLGRYQESLDAYDHALALGQSSIRWRGKAAALQKLGRTSEADEAERKAKELEAQEKK